MYIGKSILKTSKRLNKLLFWFLNIQFLQFYVSQFAILIALCTICSYLGEKKDHANTK